METRTVKPPKASPNIGLRAMPGFIDVLILV